MHSFLVNVTLHLCPRTESHVSNYQKELSNLQPLKSPLTESHVSITEVIHHAIHARGLIITLITDI